MFDALLPKLVDSELVELQRLLVLTLAGHAPVKLVRFVRQVMTRPPSLMSGPARDYLDQWMLRAASPDIAVRFDNVYNFFVLAQLPEFQRHLHALRGAQFTSAQREIMQTAWDYWPRTVTDPSVPEGLDPQWGDWGAGQDLLRQTEDYFLANVKKVNNQAAALLWENLRAYQEDLETAEALTDRIIAAAEAATKADGPSGQPGCSI